MSFRTISICLPSANDPGIESDFRRTMQSVEVLDASRSPRTRTKLRMFSLRFSGGHFPASLHCRRREPDGSNLSGSGSRQPGCTHAHNCNSALIKGGNTPYFQEYKTTSTLQQLLLPLHLSPPRSPWHQSST